ncbi:Rz1-like lysis system protein LysC [Escherichia coli]|nr:Rz1-like lysis system protein LysC [Escherichia coli]
MRTRIYAAGLILLCLLTLSGCENVRYSPEVQLTVSGCPRVTPCRLTEVLEWRYKAIQRSGANDE